jgi:hypothetical protein
MTNRLLGIDTASSPPVWDFPKAGSGEDSGRVRGEQLPANVKPARNMNKRKQNGAVHLTIIYNIGKNGAQTIFFALRI